MNLDQVKRCISAKTKCIIVAHIYEYATDMDRLAEIVRESGYEHQIRVIEDAAELIGGSYKGRTVGSFGDISTFSFYPNKHVTTGEGGLVLTNDDNYADRLRHGRDLFFSQDPKKRRFVHEELGFNYRMTCLQAALGNAQLLHLDEAIKRKLEMGKMYNKLLKEKLKNCDEILDSHIRLPSLKNSFGDSNIFWVYMVEILHDKITAYDMTSRLADAKVGTRPCFYPMHMQPCFQPSGKYPNALDLTRIPKSEMRESERLAEKSFYLPSGLGMTDTDIELVTQRVVEVWRDMFKV